jgi:hypothetical protein
MNRQRFIDEIVALLDVEAAARTLSQNLSTENDETYNKCVKELDRCLDKLDEIRNQG